MKKTEYRITTITNLEKLDDVYSFAVSVLGEMNSTDHTLAFYRKHALLTPSLMVYAERNGKVIGCILGGIDDDHVLVGPTAVAEGERRLGIGSAMMRRFEKEARQLHQTTLVVGARQEAEDFYLHCGYHPNLFIQLPEAGQIEQLKQLNQHYPVIWESEEGEWSRLMLATPRVDRKLQLAYGERFPGCGTQYVFIKKIV